MDMNLPQSVVFATAPACLQLLQNDGIFQTEPSSWIVKVWFCSEETGLRTSQPLQPSDFDSQSHVT